MERTPSMVSDTPNDASEIEEIKQYLIDRMPLRAFILIVDESEFCDDGHSIPKFNYVKDDHSTVFTTMGLLDATQYIIRKGFD